MYIFFGLERLSTFSDDFWVSEFYVTQGTTPLDDGPARPKGLYRQRITQHINKRDKHTCSQRDSNPRSQQTSGQNLCLKLPDHRDRVSGEYM
jgi:hypothetical protein